jgi:hypothetical protein
MLREKIALVFFLFSLIMFSPTVFSDWLSGWQYRRGVIINNTQNTNSLTDYQVLVTNPIYDETGLVGSWHFNEGSGNFVADSSTFGNTGILVNGPTWVDGKFGKALSFDGINDYIDFGDILNMAGQSLTISSWIYLNSLPPSGYTFPYIARRQNSGSFNADYLVEVTAGGAICFTYYNGAWYGLCTGGGLITTGNWYYVVVTFDSNTKTCKIYINSAEKASLTLAAGIGSNSGSIFRIAFTWYTPNNKYFNGIIDEVRIYKRVLTAQEIQNLYQAKARLDYGDIRFTDSDGITQLNYWQEADGRFWVKVPSIPASSTKTIYVYYGNTSAISASSVQNTFIPNSIYVMSGSCSVPTNCGYMDNHAEADNIRGYTANICTKYVDKIDWGSPCDNSAFNSAVRNYFYARFRFLFLPDVSGTWTFGTDSDDGSELIKSNADMYGGIHEHTVIASWYGGHGVANSLTAHTGTISLVAGQAIWMEYLYEEWAGNEGGRAGAQKPGGSMLILNTANFPNKIFARKYTSPEPNISLGGEESCFVNGQTCSLNSECCSGYCKADYDGSGKWCANSDQCVHDGVIYNSNSCSGSYVCIAGNWVNHCLNGIKDCDEEGIDCGGAYCAACAPHEFTFLINPGWNLISLPAKRIDNIIENNCGILSVFYYNASTKNYEKKDWQEIEGGRGYWSYSFLPSPCNIKVIVSTSVSISDIPELKPGYNLIGALSSSVDANQVKGNCDITSGPYYWENGWRSASLLEPGKGYWLKVSNYCRFSS